MGTRYEGSVKQQVGTAITMLQEEGKKTFTTREIHDIVGEVTPSSVSSSLHHFKRDGIIQSLGQKGKKGIYRIIIKDKPEQKDLFDMDLNFDQLGEAVYKLLKSKSEKVVTLTRDLEDCQRRKSNEAKEYKEIIAQKDKTIAKLNEQITTLRDTIDKRIGGTFKLSEMQGQ